MADKLLYIPNYDTQNKPSVDYTLWLKRFDNHLNETTKVVEPPNKKTLIKTFGTSVKKTPQWSLPP